MGETAELKRYFDEVHVRLSAIDHVKKQIASVVAPDFSLFSILWPDEVRLSNLIAQILSPRGLHGQSSIYLDLFLTHIKAHMVKKTINTSVVDAIQSSWENSASLTTTLEQSTNLISASQRRMDILIEGNGYGLMIENKPSAADQSGQLSDYAKDLSFRYKKFNGNYLMVYLSGTGNRPSKDSLTDEDRVKHEKSGNLICIDYNHFLSEWLQDCVKCTEPDRVRWILKDFIKFIENNFLLQPIEKDDSK